MKIYTYERRWGLDSSEKMKGELYQLLLDYPFAFSYTHDGNNTYLIPSLEALNKTLRGGGTDGGMSPGSVWKGFEIDQTEYDILVRKLLSLDLDKVRTQHPYTPKKLILDEELNNVKDSNLSWEKRQILKYRGVDVHMQFYGGESFSLFRGDDTLGQVSIYSSNWQSIYQGTTITNQNLIKVLDCEVVNLNHVEIVTELYQEWRNATWYAPKAELKLFIADSWDRKPSITQLFLSSDNHIVFQTKFIEIKPIIAHK